MTDVLAAWGATEIRTPRLPDPPEGWRRQVRHHVPIDKANLPPDLSSKVVGLTFEDGYPDNVNGLSTRVARLRLHREPSNLYDSNAVAVIEVDPETGEITTFGHLPAALAGRIAPEIDAGARWELAGYEVLVTPRYPDRPGLSVVLLRDPARG